MRVRITEYDRNIEISYMSKDRSGILTVTQGEKTRHPVITVEQVIPHEFRQRTHGLNVVCTVQKDIGITSSYVESAGPGCFR